MYLYGMSSWSFMECSFEYHSIHPDFGKKNIGPAGTSKLLNLPSSFYEKVFLQPMKTFHKNHNARTIGS